MDTHDDSDDFFDGVVITVPPELKLQRSVPKRRSFGPDSELGVPLLMFVGLPALALVGAAIGYALSVI